MEERKSLRMDSPPCEPRRMGTEEEDEECGDVDSWSPRLRFLVVPFTGAEAEEGDDGVGNIGMSSIRSVIDYLMALMFAMVPV